eukprot:CAMPEP_0184028508 /NCGR_PEP_ID=MMETSP0954-20121128/14888_1 /TAXON_ID=627963 /ORGANISM="Aplanochytrium sp, Strain PBS07" /LENGTH=127 /DNA_ID=CAMNT_0026313377 /DNA_START=66 /DNA_END=446 /DNA_ORIENTATION=+
MEPIGPEIRPQKRKHTDLNVILQILKNVVRNKCEELRQNGSRDWEEELGYFIEEVEHEFGTYEEMAVENYMENRKKNQLKIYSDKARCFIMEQNQNNAKTEAWIKKEEQELEEKIATNEEENNALEW